MDLQAQEQLRRMDDGRFGVCVRCGGPVEDARLEAYPYATECMDRVREAETGKAAS